MIIVACKYFVNCIKLLIALYLDIVVYLVSDYEHRHECFAFYLCHVSTALRSIIRSKVLHDISFFLLFLIGDYGLLILMAYNSTTVLSIPKFTIQH